jgi:serine/threonine protein kinase
LCAIEYSAPTTSAPGLAPSFGGMCAECSQIVHRDVKAPNVLLREVEGRWDSCIADFGTAALLPRACTI